MQRKQCALEILTFQLYLLKFSLFVTFSCEDRIINQCEEENGGCWEGTIEGKRYTACVDKIDEYKEMAAAGKMDPPPPLHECICPPCFKPTSEGGCEPKCDLDECERTGGDCPLTLLAQETVKTSKGMLEGVLSTYMSTFFFRLSLFLPTISHCVGQSCRVFVNL